MRRIFFVLLSILAICSCSKKQVWDDSHIPTAYHDGVFSFDYGGERYYPDSFRKGYGPITYYALATYHPNLDTLIIYGRFADCYIYSLLFTIPFERVTNMGRFLHLSQKELIVSPLNYNYDISVNEAFIRFDSFFDNEEYVSGVFSATIEDGEHKQSKIENGLFKMNAKSYRGQFYGRDLEGNMHYSGPKGITENGDFRK